MTAKDRCKDNVKSETMLDSLNAYFEREHDSTPAIQNLRLVWGLTKSTEHASMSYLQ